MFTTFDPLGVSEVGHWLCVPGFHRVCLFEERAKIKRQTMRQRKKEYLAERAA